MLRHFESERRRWVSGALVTAAIAIVMLSHRFEGPQYWGNLVPGR